MSTFTAVLFRTPGPGGWTFAPVPDDVPVPAAGPWGRAPVRATVDGVSWDTSVWHDSQHGVILAVPARIRRGKEHGDTVQVSLAPR